MRESVKARWCAQYAVDINCRNLSGGNPLRQPSFTRTRAVQDCFGGEPGFEFLDKLAQRQPKRQ